VTGWETKPSEVDHQPHRNDMEYVTRQWSVGTTPSSNECRHEIGNKVLLFANPYYYKNPAITNKFTMKFSTIAFVASVITIGAVTAANAFTVNTPSIQGVSHRSSRTANTPSTRLSMSQADFAKGEIDGNDVSIVCVVWTC